MKVNVCQRCLIASVHRYLSFFVHMARIRVKGNCSKCHGFSWLRGWKGGWSLPNFARGQRYNLDKGLEMWSYNQENSLGACSPCAGRKCGYGNDINPHFEHLGPLWTGKRAIFHCCYVISGIWTEKSNNFSHFTRRTAILRFQPLKATWFWAWKTRNSPITIIQSLYREIRSYETHLRNFHRKTTYQLHDDYFSEKSAIYESNTSKIKNVFETKKTSNNKKLVFCLWQPCGGKYLLKNYISQKNYTGAPAASPRRPPRFFIGPKIGGVAGARNLLSDFRGSSTCKNRCGG